MAGVGAGRCRRCRVSRNEKAAAWSLFSTDICKVQPKQKLVRRKKNKKQKTNQRVAPACLRVDINKFP